ncbi:unnamed protein product, partial [Symbiodinium microadriaticum]
MHKKKFPDKKFDEAYIIVAGFVPFWLGSVLGQSLLVVVSTVGPLGTVFIFIAWKLLVVAFEMISREIGGATYAEFIFLSVTFNSAKFWALLGVEFCVIAFWLGGFKITVIRWVSDRISGEWVILHRLKTYFLCLVGKMPYEIAERAALFKVGNFPPDVQLALIRSRAVAVQLTWTENDIKMASEFQSCACAVTAVAADMFFSYYDIGHDLIVSQLKVDIADAVASIVEFNKNRSLKKETDSFSYTPSSARDGMQRMSMYSEADSGAVEMNKLQSNYDNMRFRPTSAKLTGRQKASEEQEVMLTDLQDILQLTAVFTPAPPDATISTRNSSDQIRRPSE